MTFCLTLADLSRNNITVISDDNFKGQQNLLELNLAKNKMDQIPSGTFKYLTVSCLSSLAPPLGVNENYSRAFKAFTSLINKFLLVRTYVLNLRICWARLSSLSFHQQDLRTLNLADNSLEDLSAKVFQMLTKLKSLDLSRNPLEDLHPDVFKDIIVSSRCALPFA